MDKELEYIKLKVDWYKSMFPWMLAMIAGSLTFIQFIKEHKERDIMTVLLVITVVLLLLTLLTSWFAALALIHRLEDPYKTKSKLLNMFLWVPKGAKWEMVFGVIGSSCFGLAIAAFLSALYTYATT